MAEISQVRKCYNCGVLLQSTDPEKPGYIKKEILDNPHLNFLFCDDCFEKEKFHSLPNEPKLDPDYLKMLKDAKDNGALIVYVVNLFSFETSFSSLVNSMIKDNKIVVIANKRDLLPVEISDSDIKEYVAHRFRAAYLNVSEVLITSGSDNVANKAIIEYICENRDGKDVYVIGSKYCGKTTLVNAFLRVYSNLSKGMIVTRNYKDTALRYLAIPLDNKTFMYDTPGIGNDNSLISYFDMTSIDLFLSAKAVSKRKERLSIGQALTLGGYALIELVDSDATTENLNLYFRPQLTYKKYSTSKKTAADQFIAAINKGSLTPSLKEVQSIKDFDVYEVKVDEYNQRDIGIGGFGWFSFIGHNQTFKIYVPKNVSIYTSRVKIADPKLR